jgi:hypothetical protein
MGRTAAVRQVSVPYLAAIPQMAASFRLTLRRFGFADKPEPRLRLVDGRRAGPTPDPEPRHVEFSLIETHLSRVFIRTRDAPTPYAVDMSGGGRNSAISRRMSANNVFGTATSAIWNAT